MNHSLIKDPFGDIEEFMNSPKKKAPSRKRDRTVSCETDGDMFDSSLIMTDVADETVNLLPICYVGNKKRVMRQMWHFLEDEKVDFNTVFEAFSGSCAFSLMCLLMGKSSVMNDSMTYPSLLAPSLCGSLENCPSDLEMEKIMGEELDPSNNLNLTRDWEGLYFTKAECDFLDRYRSNVITLYGSVLYSGENPDGSPKLISLKSGNDIIESDGMKKGTFAMYLLLTLLHQLCFTGGRFFRRQIIAKLQHRLGHIRNKGQEIHSKPLDFMWLKEIRQFMFILKSKVEEYGNSARFVSSDVMDLVSGSHPPAADLLYLDPPYGGSSSDYSEIYRMFETYIYGVEPEQLPHIVDSTSRFKKPKGYRAQFEELLKHCDRYDSWLISYNGRSFTSLDEIVESIRKFRYHIEIKETDIKYRYRKGTGKGNEFIILARN